MPCAEQVRQQTIFNLFLCAKDSTTTELPVPEWLGLDTALLGPRHQPPAIREVADGPPDVGEKW
jgi:hypothetical protein